MSASRLDLPLASLVVFCTLAAPLAIAGELVVRGTVCMPDGSPAAGATVEWFDGSASFPNLARTDEAGRFRFEGAFENDFGLHARSADGNHQTVLRVSSAALRAALATPFVLTLAPALTHEVTVLTDGHPVQEAHVAARGADYKVRGVTGHDGKVELQLPAGERLRELVAWHRELGTDGGIKLDQRSPRAATKLSLLPPAPLRIRVLDSDGKPIDGVELGVHVKPKDRDWIVAWEVEEAHVRTDADGVGTVLWAPRGDLEYIEVEIFGFGWKIDKTDSERLGERFVTVHARREIAVEGRLVMPQGAPSEGLLIQGYGFGPGNTGHIPYTRVRRDGGFTLRVASEHAYVLGVADLEWASNHWSGVILGEDAAKPAEITMDVYPATPLTVSVTRGPRREPVADARVVVESNSDLNWTDAGGKNRRGSAGVSVELRTDASGAVRAGVGRGKQQVRLTSGVWNEEQSIDITSDKPAEVAFHRGWEGERRITGQLMLEGSRYAPSPALVARAWVPPRLLFFPLEFEPQVHPDGTFDVTFDAETLMLLFVDPDRHRSGFAQVGRENTTLEVTMEATATYGGTLLDEKSQPAADQNLRIYAKTTRYEVAAAQQTDPSGRFRFACLPVNVPLQLLRGPGKDGDGPEYMLFDGDRMFEPGEVRENDRVKLSLRNSPAAVAHPPVSLASDVERICRDARLSGMHALVVLQGDDSQNVAALTDRLLNVDHIGAVWSYVTLQVAAAQLETEAASLAGRRWPRPGPGEIGLVALKGDQGTIAARRIVVDPTDAAVGVGEEFLKQHKPPTRDALVLLAAAREEARNTGRRVWIVEGGPRCGPCFRLARWIDDHHTTLEKDYVIVKVIEGLDEHVTAVTDALPRKEQGGIPWYAITEPDGTVRATSDSPLGNIGCPGSVEGIRHFRKMLDRTVQRLTTEEVDTLIRSLSQ